MEQQFFKFLKDLQKDPTYISYRNKVIKEEFDKIKEQIIDEFNNHPITREIEMGPSAPNISGTLGGVGNLYSFIGFESGTDPISPIRELLQKSTYNVNDGGVSTVSKIRYEIPTPKMIFSVTPMPWATGRSWAKGIETGISGLGYYLYLKKQSDKSRSTTGVQTQSSVRSSARFRNTKYISNLINKFEKELKKINRMTI